jgi:hypothetical protein
MDRSAQSGVFSVDLFDVRQCKQTQIAVKLAPNKNFKLPPSAVPGVSHKGSAGTWKWAWKVNFWSS